MPPSTIEISLDPSRLQLDRIHAWLRETYWMPGVRRDIVERACRNSIVVGAYHGDEQVGVARVISDLATFAWLTDVYVAPEHRGHGVASRMLDALHAHPDLQTVRTWLLGTRDAQALYAGHGYQVAEGGRNMLRRMPPDRWQEPGDAA